MFFLVSGFISLVQVCSLVVIANAEVDGEIDLRGVSYFSNVRGEQTLTQTPMHLFGQIKSVSDNYRKLGGWHFSGGGGITLGEFEDWFFDVPSAHYLWKTSAVSTEYAAGRKIEDWSALDSTWNMGLWQPRMRWDYLEPETIGLVGLSTKLNITKNINLFLLGSPIDVPERGPNFFLRDQIIFSNSPWFSPVPREVVIFNQVTPVSYLVDYPALSDLLVLPNGGLKLDWISSEETRISLAYQYKPINQVLLGYSGYFDIQGVPQVPVTVTPKRIYHHLAGLETTQKIDSIDMKVDFSYNVDSPVSQDSSDTESIPQYQIAHILSALFRYDFDSSSLLQGLELSAGYLHLFGGKVHDVGGTSLGSQQGSAFESRFWLYRAVRLGGEWKLNESFTKISGTYIRELLVKGSILSLKIKHNIYRNFWGYVGVDLLGADIVRDEADSRFPDFISRYRANDRVFGGLSYVF